MFLNVMTRVLFDHQIAFVLLARAFHKTQNSGILEVSTLLFSHEQIAVNATLSSVERDDTCAIPFTPLYCATN